MSRDPRTVASARGATGPLLGALAVMHSFACNFPVHSSQSPQILNYSQRYTLCAEQKELRDRLLLEAFHVRLEQAPSAKNVERLVVHGSIFFRVASVPGDPSSFVIEGHGSHLLYYGRTDGEADRYLASADFQLMDEGPMPLSDLRTGQLTLKTRIINRAAFVADQVTVQANTFVFVRIFIKQIAPDVYVVDHDREHDIGWRVGINGSRYFVLIIGHLQVIGPNDGRDLLDIRNVGFMATDYDELIAGSLASPRRPADTAVIEWLPAPHCRDSLLGASL